MQRVPKVCNLFSFCSLFFFAFCFLFLSNTSNPLSAEEHIRLRTSFSANVIFPQRRVFRLSGTTQVEITKITATVTIKKHHARTILNIHLKNPSRARINAEILLPVPKNAVYSGFTFQGAGKEPSAKLLPAAEARQIYNSIVSKMRDPALLEFVGMNFIRSSVFPVEAGKTQQVKITYEQLLKKDGNRVDYMLPRTEALDTNIPWEIQVKIEEEQNIKTIYSPSHQLSTRRVSGNHLVTKITKSASNQPGSFRLSYLLDKKKSDKISGTFFTYPDSKTGGGYFLFLMGSAHKVSKIEKEIKREVTLVIDRSGSMNGEKIKQVKEAARQVIAGLKSGEAFNLILYNEAIEKFATNSVIKNEKTEKAIREYINAITAQGGTNIHDSLLESLKSKPRKNFLPLVLYLTDGLPTVGKIRETEISAVAKKLNPYKRRIYTFGVGMDVNTPLLDKIATLSRGTSTFVLPKDNIELKVSSVFKRLSGPILPEPKLAILDKTGEPINGKTQDLFPKILPDIFEDDQLVILGRYTSKEKISFNITADYFGTKQNFTFEMDPAKASIENAFVPRLWASRKIGAMIDIIRDMGATPGASVKNNPKLKELTEEIIRLSTEFGILTEYTSFLAREGSDLTKKKDLLKEANKFTSGGAFGTRGGKRSVSQSKNKKSWRGQKTTNYRNVHFDGDMNRVISNVIQQSNSSTFYKRGKQWVDQSIVSTKNYKADETVVFGTPAFEKLLKEVVLQNRQSSLALGRNVLLRHNNKNILITYK